MPEPQKMVHLTPAQRRRKKFSHPLTDDAPRQLTEDQLTDLLVAHFNPWSEGEKRDVDQELMCSFFRLLRSTVARYNYHWVVCRRFIPEMVSSGCEAIVDVILELRPEQFEDGDNLKTLGGLIESKIRHSIETTINNLRGVLPASERTNRSLESQDKSPIYGSVEVDLFSSHTRDLDGYNDSGFFAVDMADAIETIAKSPFEKVVLANENWGLTNIELGSKLATSPQHVGRVRASLRHRYLKLGRSYV